MFTLQQMKAAHARVRTGADFPRYIQEIKQLGLLHYEFRVADGSIVYYGANGHRVEREGSYGPLAIGGQGAAADVLATGAAAEAGMLAASGSAEAATRTGATGAIVGAGAGAAAGAAAVTVGSAATGAAAMAAGAEAAAAGAAALREAIVRHQQGLSDFPTFCRQAAAAGVEKWVIDTQRMVCTYHSSDGAVMVEEAIPQSEYA